MTSSPTTVFMTGANGFVAQHVIKQLFEKGCNVVGSVRSTEKGEQMKKLLKGYEGQFAYEVIPDFVKEDAFYKALQNHPEVTVFMHIASPVFLTTENIERDLLIPSVSGAKNVLNAIKKYAPQVTNFVYTSSAAALAGPADFFNADVTVDESSWCELTWDQAKGDTFSGYFGSKTFAERAVWDFAETEKPNFVVNSIIPVYCYGPQAFAVPDSSAHSSAHSNVTAQFLNLTPDSEIPEIAGCALFADVRDVAKAHIAAFEDENIKGQRIITSKATFNSNMIVDIIRRKFPQLKSSLPVADPKKPIKSLVADDAKSRKLLGWEFNSLETAAVAAVKQILEAKN